MSKCLVVKWNKNRRKIFEEMALDKHNSKPVTTGSGGSNADTTLCLGAGPIKRKSLEMTVGEPSKHFTGIFESLSKQHEKLNLPCILSVVGSFQRTGIILIQSLCHLSQSRRKRVMCWALSRYGKSQTSTGLDKRQATLQLCICATGDQNIKPAIVFSPRERLRDQWGEGTI